MNRVFAAAVAATALMGAATQASAVELLINGGFDAPVAGVPEPWGGFTLYAVGPVPLSGWTVESGSVDLTTTASGWGPPVSAPYSLDINGWDAGVISQSFNTVLGRSYNVSYRYSRNAANGPSPSEATVAAGGVTQNVVSTNDPLLFGTLGNFIFQTGGFSFVGDGNAATIRLSAVTQGNAGVYFDNVSVTAVPEPATWALMIGGFGLAGATLRARRRVLAAA
jgi:hypothetical protein